jgi:hypothetical protein
LSPSSHPVKNIFFSTHFGGNSMTFHHSSQVDFVCNSELPYVTFKYQNFQEALFQ